MGQCLLDWLDIVVPKSSSIKPVVTSLIDASTIGNFSTTTITGGDNNRYSMAMYLKVLIKQQHHLLMQRQIQTVFHHFQPRQMNVHVAALLRGGFHNRSCNTENRFWLIMLKSRARALGRCMSVILCIPPL